jgi:AcrR family transcriptional regulator
MGRPAGSRSADYEIKRAELAQRIALFIVREDLRRSSLRELSQAAGVTEPTLRHYFGTREGALKAAFEHYARDAQGALAQAAIPREGLRRSVRAYLEHEAERLLAGALRAKGAALVEALGSAEVADGFLATFHEPALGALEQRLASHLRRQEMRACDLHAAAMSLHGALFAALLQQELLQGKRVRPLALPAFLDALADGFARAHALDAAGASAPRAIAAGRDRALARRPC